MSTYKITDPQSGKSFLVTSDSEPSEEDLVKIISDIQKKPSEKNENKTANQETKQSPNGNPLTSSERPHQEMAEVSAENLSSEQMSDVLLDVPTLKVDELKLNVNNLDAHVALRAGVADLVKLDIGVQVGIEKVELDIKGVDAQALLKVRLKQVKEILSRALDTVDQNPQLLQHIFAPLEKPVRTDLTKATEKVEDGAEKRPGETDTVKEKKNESTDEERSNGGVKTDTNKSANNEISNQPEVSGMYQIEGTNAKGGVRAKEGQLYEAVRGVSKGVGSAVDPKSSVSIKKRRKIIRVDKTKR